jgi:hypothetical protein
MKITAKSRHLRIAAILALGMNTLIFADVVFNPLNQPQVTVGQYAIQNRDLTRGPTKAYRPWYENGAWQGDVIEYDILADGTRTTDALVGSNPPSAPGSNWMARATFADKEAADANYWKHRNIISYNDGQIDFTWNALSTAQKMALDPAACDPNGDGNTSDMLTESEVLNYIRGDHTNEKINGGYFRTRYSLLGDITTSPVYIGPPHELLGKMTGYATFASDKTSRAGVVATAANDGMLHILDEADGSEVFAYIPSMVIGNLSQLDGRAQAYSHAYFLSGELNAGSAQIGENWHTILTGGCGPGCAGLFALDMTDPTSTDTRIMFEKTSSDFGYIYGKPQIAPLGTDDAPHWYIITGNGYSTSSGYPTTLKFVSLDNFSIVYTVTVSGDTGGLSAPTLLSTDGDDIPDLAFAGDLNGDLWMFKIDHSNPGASTYVKVFDGSPDQPITSAPAVTRHPREEGYMVYFGTGSVLSLEDALDDGEYPAGSGTYTRKQAIYGIWVDTSAYLSNDSSVVTAFKVGLPYTSTNLQTQSLTQTSKQFITGGPTVNVRIVTTEQAVNYRCPFPSTTCTLHKGWKVALPDCGERLLGTPFVRAGRVQFVTNNPTGLNCGERTLVGNSWIMSLNFVTGGDGVTMDGGNYLNTVFYNLNGDTVLNSRDIVTVSDTPKAVVGFGIGFGNIAQPTFARLRLGTDKMFINDLILPLPQLPPPSGAFLNGHIDVETDGPNSGLLKGGNVAPNAVSKESEGYNITTSDGLGGGVDGHVHAYDLIHGVTWVDLFQLEPRRGLANLGAVVSDPSCGTTTNHKQIAVGTKCIDAVEGELNRAYDTLQTDANGFAEDSMQSEVYSLGGSTPLDPNQKFIVVLANADRSNDGYLQIGCRTWPVLAYQNMITTQLESGKAPSALVDTDGGGLVFTLAGIYGANPSTCPSGEFAIQHGLSSTPTLRVGFGQQSIYKGGIHATLPQCVLGLHDYRDKICYSDQRTLTAAESAVARIKAGTIKPRVYKSCGGIDPSVPPDNYLRDPAQNLHITKDGSGYRWRNGALTVQLLKVDNTTNAALYTLQDPGTLTSNSGTIAKAFTTNGGITANTTTKGPNESGLLYEVTMFWHYGALANDWRRGTIASIPCFGDSNYQSAEGQEQKGLNNGDYQKLAGPVLDQIDAYAAALQALKTARTQQDEGGVSQALLALAQLLANPDLAQYDKYRIYAPGHVPEQKLLDIDKGQLDAGGSGNRSTYDGSPADVTAIETIDLEAKGPNYFYGRRNWVDIRQ